MFVGKVRLIVPLALLALVLGAGSATGSTWVTGFCEELENFAESIPLGESRTVTLKRGGSWGADWYKACDHGNYWRSIEFCDWWLENSWAEFMGFNLSIAISCLDGHRDDAKVERWEPDMWQGHIRYLEPLDDSNANVSLEYLLGLESETGEDEQFIRMTIDH